jgi:predicted kinase
VRSVRVILVGGTSSVGKSTTARSLADRLGWACVSTDRLGRHPGRPWRADPHGDPVPAHVVRHYQTLAVADLAAAQLHHYERLWPTVAALATGPASTGLVVEGSGVLPDGVAALRGDDVAAVWLSAEAATIVARIRAMSRYAGADDTARAMVDAFVGRTLAYQRIVLAAVRARGLPVVEVDGLSTAELVAACMRAARA